jgi:hypothetical protein
MISTALQPPRSPAAPARPLERQLERAARWLQDFLCAAAERYGAAALDTIDLPPLVGPGGELVPAQLRAVGALLWAREVEAAGLPSFVDALADGVLEGKVLLPIAAGADRLMLYRRTRTRRFSAGERQAIYARLFGEPGDAAHPFTAGFGALLGALDQLARAGRQESPLAPAARAYAAARELGTWLCARAGGIAAFAARAIADQIRESLAVLRHPELVQALGGGGPWQLLRIHAPQVLGHPVNPEPHLQRAGAAMEIFGWLADAAAAIEAGAAAAPPPAALEAAESWLAAGQGRA